MGTLIFTKLEYFITRNKSKTDLSTKLESLGTSDEVQRLIVDFDLMDDSYQKLLSLDAILDTGAIISLLPNSYLELFPNIETESHTIWGINGDPHCVISAQIALIWIKLTDKKGTESDPVQIPIAFASNDNAPHLLGLKSLFEFFSLNVDFKTNKFFLEFS